MTVTGHRPNKISNDLYKWNTPLSGKFIEFFKNYIRDFSEGEKVVCRSGVALGIDTMFAIAVIRLRKEGYDVELESCVPCLNQDGRWNEYSKALYRSILDSSDKVTYVSPHPYTNKCMQVRNEYMIDNGCSRVLAVWDGTKGGTSNAVNYANKKGVPIDIVNPATIMEIK